MEVNLKEKKPNGYFTMNIKESYITKSKKLLRAKKILLCISVILVAIVSDLLALPIIIGVSLQVVVWILGEDIIEYLLESLLKLKHRVHWFSK